MLDATISAALAKLDRELKDAALVVGKFPEADAMLGLYFAVAISGVCEESIERLLCKRSQRAGDAPICSFVEWALDTRFRNPDFATLKGTLGEFDGTWVNRLESLIDPDMDGGALSAIVKVKNDVAHGGKMRLSLTVKDVTQHYTKAKRVLDALETVLAI